MKPAKCKWRPAPFMDQPMIVVNFKTYASASGEAAETLLAAMEAHADGPATLVAVASAFDLATLAGRATNVEVWSCLLYTSPSPRDIS